jgi:mRNA-degrading endonuclease RelE of RelBE toxin-antitoxin system
VFEIRLTPEARRFYERATPKTQRLINRCFAILKETPTWHANVKRLHGPLEGRSRYRVASLRAIYTVDEEARQVVVELHLIPSAAERHGRRSCSG